MIDAQLDEPQRCLLITPLTFYTFHHILADGLKRRGYMVETLNEEFPANPFGKILGKLALPLLRMSTLRGLKTRLDHLEPFDLVVIIKGRGLGRAALHYLRTKARRIVGYNFDSFGFNPSPLDWHTLTDRYATFDIDDAVRYSIPLVHLFSAATPSEDLHQRHDLSIVQRVHSDRLGYAERLLTALPDGWRPFVFLFESSYLTFALGLLRSPLLYLRMRKYISFKALSYTDAMAGLQGSRVTFDFAHPKQSGITVRCFEAQSLGVAILTNNLAAMHSSVFEPGTIAYLPPDADAAMITTLLEDLAEKRPAPKARTLEVFLDELLAQPIQD